MKALFFHTLCGASGDMILASLIECGVPVEFLQRELAKTGIEGLRIETEHLQRGGVECGHLKLAWTTQKEFRHLPQILAIIKAGGYPDTVVDRCVRVLNRIGTAEAKVHGVTIDEIHFHEIGAVDTIIDVLGASLAIEYLGIEKIYFSTLTEGHGTIHIDHGMMPVPAPATASMIEGFRLTTLEIETEVLTPTGCGILTALGEQIAGGPRGTIKAIGYGCGTKQFKHYPNYLRTTLFETAEESAADEVWVIETNLDHVSGEVMGFTADELLRNGALDIVWTPVFMKKGRPAYQLAVMCAEAQRDSLIDCIMRNTRTLGVRFSCMTRRIAERTSADAQFMGATVAAKQCAWNGQSFTKLEYDACAALARERAIPLIEVMSAWERR
jgi:uncharacterized protein (TIGR00299 family) protein